jgi:hypothetical protein
MAGNRGEHWQPGTIAAACLIAAAVIYFMVPAMPVGCWIVFGLLVVAGLALAVVAGHSLRS